MENKKNTNNIAHKNMLTIITAVFLATNALSLNAMEKIPELFIKGIHKYYNDLTDLRIAILYKNIDEIKKSIDLNKGTDSLPIYLFFAINMNKTEAARLLIKNIDNINYKDENSWTAIHWAARTNNTEVIKELIDKGADINVKDKYGFTALSLAIRFNSKKAKKLLIDKNADINVKDEYGFTVLHWAARTNNTKVIKELIDKGAGINVKDENGLTALDLAIRFNSEEAIKLLTERKRSRDKFEEDNKNNVYNYPETKKEKLDLLNQ